MKKCEFQINITMIIASGRIFNPSPYTGIFGNLVDIKTADDQKIIILGLTESF